MKKPLIALLVLMAGLSPVVAQQFPTVPDRTVIGRVGTGSGSGPSQAIPFTTLGIDIAASYQHVATKADIATTTVKSTVTMLQTSGYATVGDNGAGVYTRIPASTAAPWRAQSADGQWWALNNRIWTPEQYGCFTGTDCTAAFLAMSTQLQAASSNGIANGGIIVNFLPGADYQIWPTTSTPGFAAINLNGASGITINFNGARISTSNTWAHGNANVILLAHSSAITLNDPYYVATDASCTTIDPNKCGVFIGVADGTAPYTDGLQINNLRQNGGSAGLSVSGLDGSSTCIGGQKNISIINATFDNVFYGLAFTCGGDNVFARGIKGTNNGRLYFPSNVNKHDVELIGSTGGNGFVTALLATTGQPAASEERRTLADIKLRYKSVDVTTPSAAPIGLGMGQVTPEVTVSAGANNGAGLIRLTVNSTATMATGQQWHVEATSGSATATGNWTITVIDATHVDLQGSTFAATSAGYMRVPQTIRNIDIEVNLSASTLRSVALATYKTNSDGTPDVKTSGYIMANVSLSGTIRNYDYGEPAISLFLNNAKSTGTWVGETVRNIKLSDLIITGTNSSVLIDATNVSDPGLILENIYSTPTTVPWTITGIGSTTKIMSVSATGVTDRNTVAPTTCSAGLAVVGVSNQGAVSCSGFAAVAGTAHGDSDYTILATDRYIYTSANFTAARTWTLPAANAVPSGTTLWIQDARNTVTSTNTLTVQRAGADTIDTGSTSVVINNASGGITLISDGTSNWGTPVQTVSTGGTGLKLGTSGGVPCYTSTTTMASSALLTGSNLLIGGGAGACPTSTSTGSGVLTGLSNSVNTSGGFLTTLTVGTATITSGTSNGVLTNNAGVLANTAAGTNGQLFLGVTGSAPNWGTMSQDCTITNAGVITCTGINNVNQTTAYSTFTPSITCGSGSLAGYTTQTGRYKLLGKTAFFSINIVPNGAGTCSGSTTIAGLPFTTGTAANQVLPVRDNTLGVLMMGIVATSGTTISVTTSGGGNPAVNTPISTNGTVETN